MRISPALIVLGVMAVPSVWASPEGGTAAIAKDLVETLSARQLTAIAAKDPDTPGHYIAALSFPGVQLLVVSAPYPEPAVLDDAIARKDFQTVYGALQGPNIRQGKLFFHDMGADGLRSDGDGAVDVLYEEGTQKTVFDGSRKARDKFAKAENTYERLLNVLLAQAKTLQEPR